MAIVSKAVVPDLALVDPLCTTTMDAYLTACTAVDALTHAIEAFVSTGSSPITDLHAEEAIRLVGRHILAVLLHPADLEERGGMALASLQAGLAFSNASLGAVHAMAHALGGLLDLPHGECNALLLEHVVDFNFPAAPERYRRVAANLGVSVDKLSDGEVRRALRERLCGLRKQAGIEGSLSGRGVSRDDIPGLTRNAIRDICMVTNPRVACQRDIEVIYESAL
jgi:alcohol dehydrogenase class IV